MSIDEREVWLMLLQSEMRNLSESLFLAGWMSNLEYYLWAMLKGAPYPKCVADTIKDFDIGPPLVMNRMYRVHFKALQLLSDKTGCWLMDNRRGMNGNIDPVGIEEWVKTYTEWVERENKLLEKYK